MIRVTTAPLRSEPCHAPSKVVEHAWSFRCLEALSLIGAQQIRNPDLRRPLGSFPSPDQGTLTRPRDIETTKRAQQLLKEHGTALIEEGLLSP